MTTQLVSTWPQRDLLPALRVLLDEADESLLCVAFVNRKGLSLIDRELKGAAQRGRCRLLFTSVFAGGVTAQAARELGELGIEVKVLNWRGGTYHPKMYLTRSGESPVGMIGSANLTSGLIANVESAVVLRGDPAADAWSVGEQLWHHSFAEPWVSQEQAPEERLSVELAGLLRASIPEGSIVETLARRAPNRIDRIGPSGVYVSTKRSTRPQLVDAWMLDLAWAELKVTGVLSNERLLNGLRVHRSSFVCAALARLPGVVVVSRDPIELRLYTHP